MEDRGIELRFSANSPQVGDHFFFVIGVGDVDGLNQEPRGDDVFSAVVKLDVQRERIWRRQVELKLIFYHYFPI